MESCFLQSWKAVFCNHGKLFSAIMEMNTEILIY